MTIDKKTIEHVAKISRLELENKEIEKFSKEIEDILNAFKKIDEVDTKNTDPSFHPQKIKNIWREDSAEKWDWDPLSNTSHKEKRHFKGPRIV
jgi:aspartyl-tRNA(Asn)/glutamyl-tRNA(Gln) amidotransferase subunit C